MDIHDEGPPFADLIASVEEVRTRVLQTGDALLARWQPWITRPEYLPSARNLAYYLALRQTDLRPLQMQLIPWGLSSLGRSEAHVRETLDNLVATLTALDRQERHAAPHRPEEFFVGDKRLDDEACRVLGPEPEHRRARIMVTFPTEAAPDYHLVREWIDCGMNIARINCAHDSPSEWEAMVANVRRAEMESGRPCKIEFDLAGPKVRIAETSFKKHVFVKGERLLLARGTPGQTADFPRQISCTAEHAVDQARPGDRIWIDDGLIGTRVESVRPEGLELVVEHVKADGERIRAGKGLNFPDTLLDVPALTEKDIADLDVAARHADMIGYSFVQTPADIERLLIELEKRIPDAERRSRIAIVEKIERPHAVRNLPALIVAAAGRQPVAVMIARGDLAVEVGFERLAEIQEEIMWICEAAHVPVIWATQVFETLAKTGVPTRSEITDAAMSERAECVMLNKGDFLAQAITALDDVLVRMGGHQFKKRAELRALLSWPLDMPA